MPEETQKTIRYSVILALPLTDEIPSFPFGGRSGNLGTCYVRRPYFRGMNFHLCRNPRHSTAIFFFKTTRSSVMLEIQLLEVRRRRYIYFPPSHRPCQCVALYSKLQFQLGLHTQSEAFIQLDSPSPRLLMTHFTDKRNRSQPHSTDKGNQKCRLRGYYASVPLNGPSIQVISWTVQSSSVILVV